MTLGYAIDEWQRTSEHQDSTRERYCGYIIGIIGWTIRLALGDVPVNKLIARMLDLADLRHCRMRCDEQSFVQRKATGKHDCKSAKCKPMAVSPVRQAMRLAYRGAR